MTFPCRSAIILLLLATFAGPGVSRGEDRPGAPPGLTVRGEARLHVPADQVRLTLGVVTTRDTADAALQANTEAMRDVVSAVAAAGLKQKEYQTGQFQIRPDWAPRPRNAGEDWKPRIAAYTVTNTLNIKTRKLELAGKLIAAGTQAGANDIGALVFDLAEPRDYRSLAIREAVANARADASALAEAAMVRLDRVRSLSLDEAAEQPVRIGGAEYARAAVARDAGPDITPGEVTVRATVLMVYDISAAEDSKR